MNAFALLTKKDKKKTKKSPTEVELFFKIKFGFLTLNMVRQE